ncbi:MAG: pyridoxal-phosphate dependent enzyme [Winogradskyella sp.]
MLKDVQFENIRVDNQVFIKPEYMTHQFISGNKYRKLKYNLIEAKNQNHDTLLTFGGAFSNHIAATAYAGKICGFNTIGVIRGEELVHEMKSNPTLTFAKSCGMQFHFIDREAYRKKNENDFLEDLKSKFGSFYTLPEGGTNALAVKGCEEILMPEDQQFDYICVCVGTGGTISGIINSSRNDQKILGFPALKGDFLKADIRKFAHQQNWELIADYHFGGYAKIKPELVTFINEFKQKTNIPLDPVYTGKMMFGIYDLLAKNYFPRDSRILAIHTGGLQGILGMNQRLRRKNMPLIKE